MLVKACLRTRGCLTHRIAYASSLPGEFICEFVLARLPPAREHAGGGLVPGKDPSMSYVSDRSPGGLAQLAELEKALLGRIDEANDALTRADCFDEEQRAEIHAILEAIRQDSEFHAHYVGSLGSEACHV